MTVPLTRNRLRIIPDIIHKGSNMDLIFLCLSLLIFVAGAGYAVSMKKDNRIPWQSFLLILLAATAVAMWLAVQPFIEEGTVLYKFFYAVYYVLQSAVGGGDYSLFSDALDRISFWRIYTLILHLLMPVTTYGVILAYFVQAFSWFRYMLFRGNKRIILFPEVSDKIRAYAKRIEEKNTLLIFCNMEEGEKEIFDERNSRNMIFTDQSELQILKQVKKRDLTIMEMSEDEDRNVQQSAEIIDFLTKKCSISDEDAKTISLYTAAGKPEAATILDIMMGRGIGREPLSIRQTVINEEKRIAFNLLHESPLYQLVDEDTDRLDIMIIGFGRMGMELLKAVSWAGCFPDTDTNIHVIGEDAIENGKRLLSECPELGIDLRHEGGFLDPAGGEQLNPDAPVYYYSTEIAGPEFDEVIRNLAHCRYIVAACDDDADTLHAALHAWRLIKQENHKHKIRTAAPVIHVRIRNDKKKQMFSSKEDGFIFKNFKCFGNYAEIYSANGAGRQGLEHLAMRACNLYGDEHRGADGKEKYINLPEAEKNANIAASLHILYKLHLLKHIKAVKQDENLFEGEQERITAENRSVFAESISEAELLKTTEWEHTRWQAYMRTEGFIHTPYDAIKDIFDQYKDEKFEDAVRMTFNELLEARSHPCIGETETYLKQVSLLLGDPNDPYYFLKNNRRFVNSIPDILGGAYKLVPAKKE